MTTSDALEARNHDHVLIIVFDVFVLLGICLLLCTILPAVLSKAVQRGVGWYSLMTAWLVHTSSYGLLVGRQEGPDPSLPICLAQTLFIYAAPTLVSTATLCYYVEFFLVIYSFRSGTPRQSSSRSTRVLWLSIIPWIVFLLTIVVILLFIFLGNRLSQVKRKPVGFYCHLTDGTPSMIVASVVVSCMAVLLSLESYTAYLMFENWNVFKLLSKNDRQFFVILYLRLLLCTVTAVLAFVFSTLSLAPARSPTLIYPIFPVIIAIAFGTQKFSLILCLQDLLRAWLFWRSPRSYGSIIFNNGTRSDTVPSSIPVAHSLAGGEITTTFRDGSSGTPRQNQSEEC